MRWPPHSARPPKRPTVRLTGRPLDRLPARPPDRRPTARPTDRLPSRPPARSSGRPPDWSPCPTVRRIARPPARPTFRPTRRPTPHRNMSSFRGSSWGRMPAGPRSGMRTAKPSRPARGSGPILRRQAGSDARHILAEIGCALGRASRELSGPSVLEVSGRARACAHGARLQGGYQEWNTSYARGHGSTPDSVVALCILEALSNFRTTRHRKNAGGARGGWPRRAGRHSRAVELLNTCSKCVI